MTSEHNYPCVIGIDLGDESTLSVAHFMDPFNIIKLYTTGTGNSKGSAPSSVLSFEEDENKEEILCDVSASEIDFNAFLWEIFEYGIGRGDFKELLFNIRTTDENLERLKKGLTLKKVLTDYLSLLVHIAFEKLEVSNKIKRSRYSNDFKEANIRYCFVCPQSLRDYMTECFVDAGIIQEHEVNQRLSFVTEVEAVAYSILSLDMYTTSLTPNQSYLVCNVSEIAFGIAEINVDTTESLSTVKLLYESTDYGSTALQANFRNYLIENSIGLNLNDSIIDYLVEEYISLSGTSIADKQRSAETLGFLHHNNLNEENPKTNAFSSFLDANETPITITFGDLNRFVYQPFIKHLTQRIIGSFKSLENRKLILSGKYCYDSHFIDYLLYNSDKTFLEFASILHKYYIEESFGAVSAAIRLKDYQLPFIIDNVVDENDNAYETENTNQNFDFVIGIDFGQRYAGCSYVDIRNSKNVIKTIKADDWPGVGFSVLDKIPILLLRSKITKEYTAWGKEVIFQAAYDKNAPTCGSLLNTLRPDYRGLKENEESLYYYLMRLNEHVKEFIIENETKGKMKIEKYQFRYVMTLPNRWDNSSKKYLVQAAIKSQIIQENEINHLTLITEPDAAMFFCKNLLYKYFGDFGSERKTFILCDAGGLFIELFTYHCHVQAGELNFFQILTSSRCNEGSKNLDVNFADYLRDIYRKSINTYDDFDIIISAETLDYFENVYKPRYMQYLTDDDDGYHDFNMSGSIRLDAMRKPASMEKNILSYINTTIRIRNEDIKIEIVDPVVNNVLNAIKGQCEKTEDNGIKIEGIIMVGGFSQSKYLQKQVKKEFRGIYKVILPDEPINAFSRGAVEFALNSSDLLEEYRESSLFLEVQRPLKKYDLVQPSCSKLKGPNGRYYLKNYQQYFIKFGDKIKMNNPPYCFSQLILVEYPKSAVIAIYIKNEINEQFKVTEIRLDILPETSGIQNGDLIEYKVAVKLFPTEVAVQISSENPKTFFDYGTFFLRKYNPDYGSCDDFQLVLIDNYLVNFFEPSPYYIDQL